MDHRLSLCFASLAHSGKVHLIALEHRSKSLIPRKVNTSSAENLAHWASWVRKYLELTARSAVRLLWPLLISVPTSCPCLDWANAAVPLQGLAAAWPAPCCPFSHRGVAGPFSYSNETMDLRDAR